jgi:SAM-dependent methyltransferase
MDDFTNLKITKNNLDIYQIRIKVFNFIKSSLSLFSGKILDVGCGKMPYKKYILENSKVTEYIGLDIDDALIYDKKIKPDYTWDGIRMPFENNAFECAIGTEVLEHCPNPEIILKEIYRILKPGGVFLFTVPFLWNLHEVPHDEYRYTPFSLERHLKNSGFKDVTIKATGGWHASMAQMLGLWIRRSPMKHKKRLLLSRLVKPAIKYLIKLDNPEKVQFKNGQMITGLCGYVKK